MWIIRTNSSQRVKNSHKFFRALFDIISSSGRSFSYGLGTFQRPSVRPTVIISPPRPLVGLFLNLVRMFPSVSSCASIKKNFGPSRNRAAVGHLWCFLLSHLLRNYLTDSNETCLLCLPQCLNVQEQKNIPVRRQIWPFGSRLGLSEISHWQACYRISSKTTGRIFFKILVRMFLSMSSCASTKKKKTICQKTWPPSAIFDFSSNRISSETTGWIRMKLAY